MAKDCSGVEKRKCFRCKKVEHRIGNCKQEPKGNIAIREENETNGMVTSVRIDSKKMISILQINVDCGRMAQNLTEAKIKEKGIDVLIICEQYKNKTQENGWYHDSSGKAAVAVIN